MFVLCGGGENSGREKRGAVVVLYIVGVKEREREKAFLLSAHWIPSTTTTKTRKTCYKGGERGKRVEAEQEKGEREGKFMRSD